MVAFEVEASSSSVSLPTPASPVRVRTASGPKCEDVLSGPIWKLVRVHQGINGNNQAGNTSGLGLFFLQNKSPLRKSPASYSSSHALAPYAAPRALLWFR